MPITEPGVECCWITVVAIPLESSLDIDCCPLDQFCETEIEDLRVAIARDHDVVRLEIAMNDPGCVSLG